MKKLKLRFKKALFAFFKEEILASVGYNNSKPKIEYVTKELRLIQIKKEIVLENNIPYQYARDISCGRILKER